MADQNLRLTAEVVRVRSASSATNCAGFVHRARFSTIGLTDIVNVQLAAHAPVRTS